MLELPNIIKKRYYIANKIKKNISTKSPKFFRINNIPNKSIPSLYFITVEINTNKLKKNKILKYLKKMVLVSMKNIENLYLNGNGLVNIQKNINLINAYNYREKTINLYFNEKFKEKDIEYLISIFRKQKKNLINI